MVLLQGSTLTNTDWNLVEAAAMMTVTELARQAEVTPDTVRYYLRLGLLQPQWHPSNRYRLFTEADARRLCFIHRARILGFSLTEIAEILMASVRGDVLCPEACQIVVNGATRNRARLVRLERAQVLLDTALKTWEGIPGSVPDGRAMKALIESIGLDQNH